MTPTEQDNELRERIELRNRLKNLSIFRLGFGFDVFELIEFILADRKKHELQTALKELKWAKTASVWNIEVRISELEKELEKL